MKVLVACEESQRVYKSGNGGCVNRCRKDALGLINCKRAENEQEINQIKSEAVKEFAEKLKRYSFADNLSLNGKETVYVEDIDNLVKEMEEEA